ncbi:terpene cyclase/mutase family protein [Planctomycetota bacterium]|nr:terpene cyclase/mutase family protein [Planctomycetota bacterium]
MTRRRAYVRLRRSWRARQVRWGKSIRNAGRRAVHLGGSYGSSLLVHGAILGVMTLIVIALPRTDSAPPIVMRATPAAMPQEELAIVASAPDMDGEDLLDTQWEEEDPQFAEVPEGTEVADRTRVDTPNERAEALAIQGPSGAGPLGQRTDKRTLRREGGSAKTEGAVVAALDWLRRHQAPDGRWDADGWSGQCEGERCAGPGHDTPRPQDHDKHDVGVTALAVLAFLGNGHTHRFGVYKDTVQAALRWLRSQQAESGALGRSARRHWMYDHAVATFALAEAYAVTRDVGLRRPAIRAVAFLVRAQNPGAGWRYGVRPGDNDTSITGWAVLAMKAARTAGLDVHPEVWDGAMSWFDTVTDTSGRAGYVQADGRTAFMQERPTQPPTNTAVVVACRLFSGRASVRSLKPSVEILMDRLPQWDPSAEHVNFYYWYYGTLALFQAGGNRWRRWNRAMNAALVPHQRSEGCARGSWNAEGQWSLAGGRVYGTAINALTLEVYYRYLRAEGQTTH